MDTHAHAEQHRELPLADASLSSHNSACSACHLLDAATNLLYISKVVTGRNSNSSLPPEGSEDLHLWQKSCRNKTQTCLSEKPVTSMTGSKQAFLHHLLIPLITEIQCPQWPQQGAPLQNIDCITTRAVSKRRHKNQSHWLLILINSCQILQF